MLPFLQLGLAALAAQLPFYFSPISLAPALQTQMATTKPEFALKEATDALSPQDMLTLPRSGVPLPNDIGDLAIVPISTHSFQDNKYAPRSFLILIMYH